VDLPSQALKDAVAKDDFARKTLELTRDWVYTSGRDFERLSRSGKPVFKDEESAILWNALCLILGNEDKPSEGKANVSGVPIPIRAIHQMEEALKKGSDS
jgi:hypothetical protein